MNENILSENWYIYEYINDENQYVKCIYRRVEAFRFYLRFLSEHFNPCPHCQKELKKLILKSSMILGNKSYEPPVEFRYSYETDDPSFITLDEHKATDEEIETYEEGITTEITKEDKEKIVGTKKPDAY